MGGAALPQKRVRYLSMPRPNILFGKYSPIVWRSLPIVTYGILGRFFLDCLQHSSTALSSGEAVERNARRMPVIYLSVLSTTLALCCGVWSTIVKAMSNSFISAVLRKNVAVELAVLPEDLLAV